MRYLAMCVVPFLSLAGCSHATNAKPGEAERHGMAGQSLFDTDRATLETDSIEKILSAEVRIPKQSRLAVIQFGGYLPWLDYHHDLATPKPDIQNQLIADLKRSAWLDWVLLLPSLVTPKRHTIPHLREAAARTQADMMLVYRLSSRSNIKRGFFGPERIKSQCMAEAVLLDVRTGLIPFTSVSIQGHEAEAKRGDPSWEAVRHAEIEAASKALKKVAEDMSKFIEGLPELGNADRRSPATDARPTR